MRHVINLSGGIASWAAAKRVVDRFGRDDVTLLFADTNYEDEDLYRFLIDVAVNLDVGITRIADGRTPWEVFRDERFLGNSRVDPCSKILKRQLLDAWRCENCDPDDTTIYVGLDCFESTRLKRLQQRLAPWQVDSPLMWAPKLSKPMCTEWLEREGIEVPHMYRLGFSTNNCGGRCVKAGHAHWKMLLEKSPERFAECEKREQDMRDYLGRDDIAILTDRRGGVRKPLTLREFRERLEREEYTAQEQMCFEFGGCGCAID